MKITKQIIVSAICLAIVLLIEQFTSFDVKLQNMFFNFTDCAWLVSRQHNYILHFFLYSGIKILLIVVSSAVLITFLASFEAAKLRQYRYAFIVFLASMALVPLVLAGAKKYTNVYCPGQLSIYCGSKPYAKLFESYPKDFDRKANNKGRCFPAGHASGGFALMALFFCFKKRRNKILGLMTGVSLGWAMGLYQMFRGEHFLSHTLASMFGAWILILLVVAATDRLRHRYPRFFAAR